MIVRILRSLFDERARLRDLCLVQVKLSFRPAGLSNDGSLVSPHTKDHCNHGKDYGDQCERTAEHRRPEAAPCVSSLNLGLLVFGIQFALTLLLSFRPLSLARLAAFRQESHRRRESGMVARGPGLVRLVFAAPI